jgi:hypothetical protein
MTTSSREPDPPLRANLKLAAGSRPFQQVNATSVPPPHGSPPAPGTPNDSVPALLLDQLLREAARGKHDLAPAPRRSRRRVRDYWLLLLLGNGTLAGATVMVGRDPIFLYVGSAVAIFFSVSLTWILWAVMDHY